MVGAAVAEFRAGGGGERECKCEGGEGFHRAAGDAGDASIRRCGSVQLSSGREFTKPWKGRVLI